MFRLRQAVYDYDQDTAAQYEIAFENLADGHVLRDKFQQGHLIGLSGQVARRPPEDSLESRPCYPCRDESPW